MKKRLETCLSKENGMYYKEEQNEKKNYTNFTVEGLDKETYCNAVRFGLIKNCDGSMNEVYLARKGDVPTYVILGTKNPIEEYPKTELGFVTIRHVELVISAEIPKVENDVIDDMDQFVYMILMDSSKTLEEKINRIQSEINVGLSR